MKEYTEGKTWWRRNRNWIFGVGILIVGCVTMVLMVLGKPIGDFAKAMLDPSIYNNAYHLVQEDERVIALLGEVKPIGFFEVLEGEVLYPEINKAMITVGIKGSKQKGKMDIVAHKNNNIWEYQVIRVRTKKPKKMIKILDLN